MVNTAFHYLQTPLYADQFELVLESYAPSPNNCDDDLGHAYTYGEVHMVLCMTRLCSSLSDMHKLTLSLSGS
jgi:hypothetical protein